MLKTALLLLALFLLSPLVVLIHRLSVQVINKSGQVIDGIKQMFWK